MLYGNDKVFTLRDPFGSTMWELAYHFALKTYQYAYNQYKENEKGLKVTNNSIINLLSGTALLISAVENV